jgi:hypothetical protein
MRLRYWPEIAGCLLMTALACGQSTQPPTDPQSTGSQSTNAQPANSQSAKSQPATQKPVKPSAVAAAASASRTAVETAPPIKVIRNRDLNDGSNPPEAAKPAPSQQASATQAARDKAIQAQEEQKEKQFETQGKIFQNQIRVEKGKIIDIQNRITSLKNQFAAWSAGFAQDDEAQACWTSAYYSPYYRDWCDTGRNLKAQYEATQQQLAQEKARLEQMQEDIRRKGYGNGVYDPD